MSGVRGSTDQLTIQALVHYQRSGDGPANEWARSRIDRAIISGDILRGAVIGEWQAGWVQVVIFTFDFAVTVLNDGAEYLVTQSLATALAEHIVGESDVQVLGLLVLEEPAVDPDQPVLTTGKPSRNSEA